MDDSRSHKGMSVFAKYCYCIYISRGSHNGMVLSAFNYFNYFLIKNRWWENCGCHNGVLYIYYLIIIINVIMSRPVAGDVAGDVGLMTVCRGIS